MRQRWMKVCVAAVLFAAAAWSLEAAEGAKPWGLSLSAGAQFDDNRDGTETDKESNLDLILSPRAEWRYALERTLFDLFYAPTFKWRSNPREIADGDPQNDTELYHAVGAAFDHRLADRAWIKLGNTWAKTDDPEITAGGLTIRRNSDHWYNQAYAEAGLDVTPKVATVLNGRYNLKRYDDEVESQFQDEDVIEAQAAVKYAMGMGARFSASAGYSDFQNDHPTIDRGSQVMTYGLGLEKTFNPDLIAGVSAGYQSAEYDDDRLETDDTVFGKADVVIGAASPTRLRVGGLYGYFAPYVRPYSIQKLTSVSAAVEHDVTAKLLVSVSGRYSDGDYPAEPVNGLAGGHDKLMEAGLKGVFKLNRNLSFDLGYTYQTWDSDVREDFDRNVVSAAVRAQM